jgi:hypothetical protein
MFNDKSIELVLATKCYFDIIVQIMNRQPLYDMTSYISQTIRKHETQYFAILLNYNT